MFIPLFVSIDSTYNPADVSFHDQNIDTDPETLHWNGDNLSRRDPDDVQCYYQMVSLMMIQTPAQGVSGQSKHAYYGRRFHYQ